MWSKGNPKFEILSTMYVYCIYFKSYAWNSEPYGLSKVLVDFVFVQNEGSPYLKKLPCTGKRMQHLTIFSQIEGPFNSKKDHEGWRLQTEKLKSLKICPTLKSIFLLEFGEFFCRWVVKEQYITSEEWSPPNRKTYLWAQYGF